MVTQGANVGRLNKRGLLISIAEAARTIAEEGRGFNRHLLAQFERWDAVDLEWVQRLPATPSEHLLFYKAVAQTLGWLQGAPVEEQPADKGPKRTLSPLPILYLRVILESRQGKASEVEGRLKKLISETTHPTEVRKPRRLFGVIAGLETWAKVVLPEVGDGDILDLEEVQRLATDAGGRARWTALAPIKMYSIAKGLGAATPRAIYPPMGRAVSRGIDRLLGFTLGESENDYKVSRGLHLKLADLANASIWDINSGFYKLGDGS